MTSQKITYDQERPLMEHIRELAQRLRRVVFYLGGLFVFYFLFGVKIADINGVLVPYPYPDFLNSISTQTVRFFVDHDVPSGMYLININAFDPIFASMQVSFLFSLFTGIPVILREVWGFVSPALYEHEKRVLRWTVLPAMFLFASGALFAYFIVIPFILVFVKFYVLELGAESTLGLRSFVNIIISFMLAFGTAFEMPLVMNILTKFGLVKSETWKRNWRYGVVGSFFIAMLISPGTTGGIIETTIGTILSLLYGLGALISSRFEKRPKDMLV